ncbi:hypothetical protein AAMO2058_001050200 [Amorphochlora amoebiformis]|eukprot:1107758-Amorphochlora_amoeboformis.AAC.1
MGRPRHTARWHEFGAKTVTATMTTSMTLEQTLAKRATANRCVIVSAVVDESGSMQTEQDWIIGAIPKIFANLLAQGLCLFGYGQFQLLRAQSFRALRSIL